VVAPGSPVLNQLSGVFGPEILCNSGELDRERLAQIIFADVKARDQLNRIIHPAIAVLAVERLRQEKENPAVRLVVYEAPLLFEAGAEGRVDKVLLVSIEPQIQLLRLMARDHLPEAAARQRIGAQMPQQEKLARADFVIDNSGSIDAALRQVDDLWDLLVEKSPC